ncbi:prominin-1 [Patella vulgata]|uniref:prominin-1 n=1 Tax=Patella vulgata TaxID=6465 RepID=UPI00218069B2|nr:prominin-1 [Patella vulgata]
MATTHTINGLLVFVISCFCIADIRGIEYKETAENQLGHKRYTNGDIEWGNIPDRDYHGNIQEKGSGVWKTTINFAKSIVLVTTHHQSFPYDLIRRIIRNEYSEDEITDYEENIVISCGVGAIFISIILICCLAYFLYKRWKSRRSVYSGQKPFLSGHKLNAVIVLGIIFILIIFIFTICILVVNARIGDGINRLDKRLYNSMDDVTSYFNQTKQQYDFMTEDSNLWFGQDVLTHDINTLGELIWQPGSRAFHPNVSAIFKELENLDLYTSRAVVSLESLIDEMVIINNGMGRHLKSNLSTANYNLSFARSDWTCIGCDGSCSGCENIVPDDIYPQVNFLTMPNLTSNLNELQELLREPFKGSLLSPEYYYTYGIGDIIQNKLATNISDIQSRVNDFINTVRRSTDGMVFPTQKSFYFDELKPKFEAFKDRVNKGDNIRSGFTWFFTVVNIGLIIFILSVLIYVITKKYKHCRTLIIQQEDPHLLQRRLLLGGAVGCIILSVGHTCLASTGFYIGANLERVICQTGKDYSIVERVLDVPHTVPGHPGYYMGSVVLGNGAFDLKLSDILRQCKNNIPAYTALRQNLVSPKLKDDLDIAKYLNDINEVFDDMYIDLNNVTLIPPRLSPWFQKLTTVTSFDTQPFTDLFNKTIINADLDTFVANLRYVANTSIANGGPRNPAKSKLIEVADHLSSWKPLIDSATIVKVSVI